MNHKVIVILIVSVLLFCIQGWAQCIPTSQYSGSTFSSVDRFGSNNWLSPNNAQSSENAYAVATTVSGGEYTDRLQVTGFEVSIPADATICGIEVEVEKQGNNTYDSEIRIIKNGSITGVDQSNPDAWPTTDTYITYGGDGNLWGTTWTPAEVMAANFGVSIQAYTSSASTAASIDHVRLTIYYDAALPIELHSFDAYNQGNTVLLEWATASETNNDYFSIMRSPDGEEWTALDTQPGAGDSYKMLYYSYTDQNPLPGTSYYRIKQTDFDGQFSYSYIRSVTNDPLKGSKDARLFPNPVLTTATLRLSDSWADKELFVRIYNNLGNLIRHYTTTSHLIEISREKLKTGKYICHVSYQDQTIHVSSFLVN